MEPITLVVPDVSELTLEDAVEYLMKNDKEAFSQLMSAVNTSGFPQTDIRISEFGKKIPIGNYTIQQAANMFSNSNIEYLIEQLGRVGVDLNRQNLLITTATYSQGNRDQFGIHEKDGKSIVLLRPNSKSIESYLKQLLVQEIYNNFSQSEKDQLSGFLDPIIDQLEASDTSRVKNILKQIQQSKDPTAAMIKYFYGSASFNHALRQSNQFYQIHNKLNELVNSQEMEIRKYSDPIVQGFASKIKDNKISTKTLQEIQAQLGTQSPVETIQEINNRITTGPYFDIEFAGDKEIIFRRVKGKPLFSFDVVNTEYYGELVKPVATVSGYNIIKHQDRYYVSDKIVTSVEDLSGSGSPSFNAAAGLIKYKLQNEGLSLTDLRQKVKLGSTAIESRSRKYKPGDRFVALDVPLKVTTLLSGDKKLASMTYEQFMKEMETSPLWRRVLNNLQDYNIREILSTPERVETFIQLRAQSRDMEAYKQAYNNKNPRIDTPEKIEYETQLSRQALDIINNAKEVVYEVVEKNGNKYLVKPLEINDRIPLYTRQSRSFKSELITIAEYLDKNFGVKTNLVTTSDIARDFKKIIPNAGRVNAFIFNNEIYINVDKATTADSLHEFAHIVMGTIKRTSPKLYYGLLQRIEELPDYNLRLSKFAGDGRARTDLNEEIFVDTFGEFFARISNPWFNDKTLGMKELGEKFKQGTQKMLQTGEDINSETVGRLLNMSVNEIMTEFGSTLAEKDPSMFDMDVAHESRIASNLIKALKESGKLIENCE